jgi:flavoprotein
MRIAWGITGAGHLLRECIELFPEQGEVHVFLSRAAMEVVRMYGLEKLLLESARSVVRDTMSSAPVVGRFAGSGYRAMVVAPATSNSVAKFVYGISDSLVSNLFAHAGKNRVPIIVLPTDLAAEMDTITPKGKMIKVYPRPVDLENTARLREFPNVTVVQDVDDLRQCLSTFS